MGHLSFDFGNRAAEFVEYLSDAQFGVAVADWLSRPRRKRSALHRALNATAEVLLDAVRKTHKHGQGSWMAYNAAVAAALVERKSDAAAMFSRILHNPARDVLHQRAERMSRLAEKPSALRAELTAQIARQRTALLQLPSLDRPPI